MELKTSSHKGGINIAVLSFVVLLATILSFSLVVTGTNASVATVDDIEYELNDDGTASVTNWGETVTDLVIPSTITIDGVEYTVTTVADSIPKHSTNLKTLIIPDTVKVIGDYAFSSQMDLASVDLGDGLGSIGEGAFWYCKNLTSVTIPDSVEKIGDYAFHGCDSLQHLDLGEGVESIGESAFSSCDSLESIVVDPANTFYASVDGILYTKDMTQLILCPARITGDLVVPDGVVTVCAYAFHQTQLTSVTIPDSVEEIGESAFEYSTISAVDLGDGLRSISDYTFEDCHNLNSVTIPDSVEEIGKYAFIGCVSLQHLDLGDGLKHIDDWAFEDCYNLESVTIPDSVEEIGEGVFYRCGSLQHLDLGNGVKTIGYDAIYRCVSLTTLEIPASVVKLGAPFYRCNSLEYIVVDPANTAYTSVDGILYTKDMSVLIQCPASYDRTSIDIPTSVVEIHSEAFRGVTSLENITVPEGVTSIFDRAFEDCVSLKEIVLPKSLNVIGDYAFYHCDAMERVTMHEGLTDIGYHAFEDCGMLTSIIIPDSVTSLGKSAFNDCTSLEELALGSGIVTLDSKLFENCYSLESITIGSGVIEIADDAFEDCRSLKDIVLEDGNTNFVLVDGVLYDSDMKGIAIYPRGDDRTEFTIPDGIDEISQGTFAGSIHLESIIIPESVTKISEGPFINCYSLKDIIIDPDNKNYSVVDGVLYTKDMKTLIQYPCDDTREGYIVPEGVERIGNKAFDNCNNLTALLFSDSVIHVSEYAVYGCRDLRHIYLGMVTEIENYAIFGNRHLEEITLNQDNSAYEVVDGVLYTKGMGELVLYPTGDPRTTFDIPEGVHTIGVVAFAGCETLVHVDIPSSVVRIESNAFYACTSLEDVQIPLTVQNLSNSAFTGVCGANSSINPGEVVGHQYVNGTCTVCGNSLHESHSSAFTGVIIVIMAILIAGAVSFLYNRR